MTSTTIPEKLPPPNSYILLPEGKEYHIQLMGSPDAFDWMLLGLIFGVLILFALVVRSGKIRN